MFLVILTWGPPRVHDGQHRSCGSQKEAWVWITGLPLALTDMYTQTNLLEAKGVLPPGTWT